jgi:hypothetical protein
MKGSSGWVRHGAWNVLEHGFSRGLDAFATVVLLWVVSPEVFSQLALAQAYVAPALFFFICPETGFYREFAAWSAEGPESMIARVRAFRRFAWLKAALALAITLPIVVWFPWPEDSPARVSTRFLSLIWAFALPLIPQFAGADREYLRLSLDLRALNLVTVFQRVFYLSSLLIAWVAFSASFASLAMAGILTSLFTAWLARYFVERRFVGIRARRLPESNPAYLFRETLRGFSFWNHLSGVVVGWTQTLDLFFLGWFRTASATVGLYGVGLKLANFMLALPYAVSNLYNVYLGRTPLPSDAKGEAAERASLLKLSVAFGGFAALQSFVLWKLAPYILAALSRGKWDASGQAQIVSWLGWILPACAIFGSCLFWTGWLSIRYSYRRLVFGVYLPWGLVAFGIYGWTARYRGVDAVAQANLPVVMVFVILLIVATVFRKKI